MYGMICGVVWFIAQIFRFNGMHEVSFIVARLKN